MDLNQIFEKWKLNHNHFSALLNMPKGTFNNKLNPTHNSIFSNQELSILKENFKEMIKDLNTFIRMYPQQDEVLTEIDEEMIYVRRTGSK
jgi:hypothetical protein